MKIVIADDERIIRLSLISMIEEFNLMDCTIVQCKNGKEMIEAVNSLKPEIAFVDIKMPIFNGLEAIQQCKDNSKNTKFIITTGFSEFEYARTSIKLGVYEYLLKPIDPLNLKVIINKVLEEDNERLKDINEEFQSDMVQLYYDEFLISEDLLSEFYSNKRFIASLFYSDNNYYNDDLVHMKKQLIKIEEPIINEMICENINVAKISIDYNSTLVIFSFLPKDYSKVNRCINKWINIYTDNVDHLTTITGNKLESLEAIRDEIIELKRYAFLRIVLGIGKNYVLNELRNSEIMERYYPISYNIYNLSYSLKNNLFIKFCDSLEKVEQILISHKTILEEDKFFNNINFFLKSTINFEYNDKFSSAWISQLSKYKENYLKKFNKNKDITEQIMEFIKQNYMCEISINTLSEMFKLTPNYISTLFHKKASMKLVDYVAKIRINKAQNLLAETNMNVNDIGESVGYHSARYFTKLFRSMNGLSPSEYRKRLND